MLPPGSTLEKTLSPAAAARWRRHGPLLIVAAGVLLASLCSIRDGYRQQREQAALQLESVSELRVSQVHDWIGRNVHSSESDQDRDVSADPHATWQDAGHPAETVLWQRVEDHLVNASNARHGANAAGRIVAPIATSSLPPARLLRGEIGAGVVVSAVDYRGTAVLAIVRAVPDTGWWLVSKLDLDQIDAPARQDARWTAMAAALTLVVTALARHLWRQRGALVASRRAPAVQGGGSGDPHDEDHDRTAQQMQRDTRIELDIALDALRDARRLNDMLMEAIPGQVAYWDQDLRCRLANGRFAREVDIAAAALPGMSLEAVHGHALGPLLAPQLHAALAGHPQHFIDEMPHRDGTPAVHQVHYLPHATAPGTPLGVCVVSIDITTETLAQRERADALDQLGATRDELRAAARARRSFLARMRCEVRTPLNAIVGTASRLTRECRDSRQAEPLHKVTASSEHLLQVLEHLVDLSDVEAGELGLELAEFSVDTWLAQSIEAVSGRMRQKGLELILDPDRLPAYVSGDLRRLSQILTHLLSTAIDIADMGWLRLQGEVTAETALRVLVRFELRHGGAGAPSERQGRFDDSESSEPSAATRGGCLALDLVRRLAMLMGGDAGVEHEQSIGRTFWFSAWLGRGRPRPSSCDATQGEGLRALVVDDLDEARSLLGERLRARGFAVDTTASGADFLSGASAVANGHRYDVILIDWDAEITGGMTASGSLHARLGDSSPPAILMTASADAAVARHASDAAFCATLLKPILGVALHESLAKALDTRSEVHAASTPRSRPACSACAGETALREDWFERSQAIPGLNVGLALKFVGGSHDTFLRVLRIFAETYAGACPGLLDATGDAAAVRGRRRAICHTALSTLGVIGATELVARVGALEARLQVNSCVTEDSVTAECEALHLDLRGLVRSIDEALWR